MQNLENEHQILRQSVVNTATPQKHLNKGNKMGAGFRQVPLPAVTTPENGLLLSPVMAGERERLLIPDSPDSPQSQQQSEMETMRQKLLVDRQQVSPSASPPHHHLHHHHHYFHHYCSHHLPLLLALLGIGLCCAWG